LNEHGEIIRIEGMLTIAFSFILPYTHRNVRKELYLIIKIPYLFRMSLEEETKSNKVETQPINLLKTFHKQRDEIEKLKLEITNLEKEKSNYLKKISDLENRFRRFEDKNKSNKINELKEENRQLKVLCGKLDSGWIQELDWLYRYNPIGEPIGYFCPKNFKYEKVTSIRFYSKSGVEWCTFWYKESDNHITSNYSIPKDAFLWLQGKLPEQKKGVKEIDIHELQSIEDITDFYISKGGKLRGKYPKKVIKFLYKTRGKSFDIHDFDRYCGFKDNRESRRLYIKKLIDFGFIKRTNNDRIYQNQI
jgi:hypothetical protein